MMRGEYGYCATCGNLAKVHGQMESGKYFGRCSTCQTLVMINEKPVRQTTRQPSQRTTKVLEKTWCSGPWGVLGIIVTENGVGERSIYAGPGSAVDLAKDVDFIRDWGGRVNPDHLREILRLYDESPKGKVRKLRAARVPDQASEQEKEGA